MRTNSEIYSYFDCLYKDVGIAWGEDSSKSAVYFSEFLTNKDVESVHLIACGYGRNALAFSNKFTLSASDNSLQAVNLLNERFDFPCFKLDVFNIEITGKYDAIYSYSLLHLFEDQERRSKIVENISKLVKVGGYIMFVNMSEENCF